MIINLSTGLNRSYINCKKFINSKLYIKKMWGGKAGNIYIYNTNNLNLNIKLINYKTLDGKLANCDNKYKKNSKDLIIIFYKIKNLKKNKIFLLLKSKNTVNNKYIKFIYNYTFNILLFGFPNSGKSTVIKNLTKFKININNYKNTKNRKNLFKIKFFNYKIYLYEIENIYSSNNFKFYNIFILIDFSLINLNFKDFYIKLKLINIIIYKNIINYYRCNWILFNKFDIINYFFLIYIKNILNILNWYYIYFFISFKNKKQSYNIIIFYIKLLREWRNRYTYQI